MTYEEFIAEKSNVGADHGFKPRYLPSCLFDFQRALCERAVRKGRSATFADCGLGKTLMQLVWADNVAQHTGKPVLILTPLSVAHQTVREAHKFQMETEASRDGSHKERIVVTNYERLHYFTPGDWSGVVCDESSILKNFDGVRKNEITNFMRHVPYRALYTATPSPNDFIELGTSSEALGEMGFSDMLSKFFKKAEATSTRADEFRQGVWRFRGHAQRDFWRWVCSWARAVRKPSDLGFSDGDFRLPAMAINEHIITARTRNPGMLFDLPAMDLQEQREETTRTIPERCEAAAALVNGTGKPAVLWCNRNPEAKLLKRLIKDAVEVSGEDPDEDKEEKFEAFETGQARVMITKPKIGGFGLNWQHCAHVVYFPSHSFEQWYQSIRRCWRYGQKNPVTVDVVCSEGESRILGNLKRKAEAAERMFYQLVELMNDELQIKKPKPVIQPMETPSWL